MKPLNSQEKLCQRSGYLTDIQMLCSFPVGAVRFMQTDSGRALAAGKYRLELDGHPHIAALVIVIVTEIFIHSSSIPLIPEWVTGELVPISSSLQARGGVHPEQVPNPS
ncbi:hypothetical protein GOODEAATRI_009728 [Goodea atripinnis]|uniref:Uncharacterized protein n=1 Tax=Goodea atripinnis TaxID=208336 RepID=A0ABV0N9B7_9TELE